MKIKFILLMCCCFLGFAAQAQTLAQAKEFYREGQYKQAKPVFKRYTKSQPGNGSYHLWYGVCCLNTGEPQQAVKHLELAVKKRVPSGKLYLGQAYYATYQFENAVEVLEEYIEDLTKRKRSTEKAEKLLDKSKLGLRLLKGVEDVCFIDSLVVDKDSFLKAYKISPECGNLYSYAEYFKKDSLAQGTVYETQLRNKLYYAEMQPDSTLSILSSNKMQGEWGKGHLLPGAINEAINANYPYVMNDGVTIFYAADGPQSIGGYDIFVTRYNTNSDTYLTPQNAGMPFNSPANDYMYVIDEYNNLGWFASDRNQPEGKVCIYIFVPNTVKKVYNFENMEDTKMRKLARLHALKDTWTDKQEVAEAQKRLKNIEVEEPVMKEKHDFEFIIDDQLTYHQLSDFKQTVALDAFKKYRELEKNFNLRKNKLKELRETYLQASEATRQQMVPGMLDLEKRIEQLVQEMAQAAILVRKLEKTTLK